jgi:uracil-DNA glycosylase family protein
VKTATALEALAAEARGCTRCPLHECGTQTVFGEGPATARIVLVGEQPGDQEDRQGRPFVGPAGGVLDGALVDAGIDRGDVYVTNAVKHFKWSAKGKRRIHERPNRAEVVACRPWLEQELALIRPDVLVVLGATAGQALWGSKFRVGAARGQTLEWAGLPAVATLHPSAILRAPDAETRHRDLTHLTDDLRRAAALLADA